MQSVLQEQFSVSPSGQSWQIGAFKLWQSTEADVIFFMPGQAGIVKADSERYQVVLTVKRKWQQGRDQITSGSLSFTTTLSPQEDFTAFEQLQQKWRKELYDRGNHTENIKFQPLPIQNIKATLHLDPKIGQLDNNIVTDATTNAAQYFYINLSDQGTQQLLDFIQSHQRFPGSLEISYEYPQTLPPMSVQIKIHGKLVFDTVRSTLKQNAQHYYGSAADLDRLWNLLLESHSIELILPDPLPPEIQTDPQNLVAIFTEQVKEHVIHLLFTKQSSDSANENVNNNTEIYTFNWRQSSNAEDFKLELSVNGWTWLKDKITTELTALLAAIDSPYVNTIYQEVTLPLSVAVERNPLIRTVALSLTSSEGLAPQALIFEAEGGDRTYPLTSKNPASISVRYQAQITFTPSKWSSIEVSGTATLNNSEYQIFLKPGQWIRQLMIQLIARDGNRTRPIAELPKGDYLVINCTYQAPHLTKPIKESARLSPKEPLRFNYLQDPQGRSGQLLCSVMGVLNGAMIRTSETQIRENESNLFILLDRNGVQLVSQSNPVPEDDELAQTLLKAQSYPLITPFN